MRNSVLVSVATAAMLAAATVPAAADPRGEYLPMTCSDGSTVSISPAPANGTFTPDFDSGSTAVFLPLSIQLTRTLRAPDGQALSVDQGPAQMLGQGRQLQRRQTVTCTSAESLTSQQDPDVPTGYALDLAITLVGTWTPRDTGTPRR
jgi:hypothetical protein